MMKIFDKDVFRNCYYYMVIKRYKSCYFGERISWFVNCYFCF